MKNQKWHLQLLKRAKTNDNLKLFFIKTHLPDYNINYEFVPKELSSNIQIYQYISIADTLEFLSSLDLIISSKLHIGLVSLSLGTPFFSYKGRGKTIAFLDSIEGKDLIINTDTEIESLINERIYLNKKDNPSLLNIDLLKQMIIDSEQHYTFIDSILLNYIK